MTDTSASPPHSTCAVGGLRFSPELVLLSCGSADRRNLPFNRLLTALGAAAIPLAFLCQSEAHRGCHNDFCVTLTDWPATRAILAADEFGDVAVIADSAGLLTVFPHRHEVRLLGTLLHCFRESAAPLYGFCSSISAITVCTGFSDLDRVAETMLRWFRLPDNHAPFRPQFMLKQPR